MDTGNQIRRRWILVYDVFRLGLNLLWWYNKISTLQSEEEYDDDEPSDEDAEDPRVIKELIDLIKKVGEYNQVFFCLWYQ